jgi:hypothetical protein
VVHDIYVVRLMIKLYAKSKSATEVARKMMLPKAEVLALLNWVWEQQDQTRRGPQCGIGVDELAAGDYLRYLFERNVSAEDAAAAVGWPVHRVLSTCGGRRQWKKKAGRKPLSVRQPEPEYLFGDPAEAVVAQELEKLRESWPAVRFGEKPRYEIPQDVDLGLVNFD